MICRWSTKWLLLVDLMCILRGSLALYDTAYGRAVLTSSYGGYRRWRMRVYR